MKKLLFFLAALMFVASCAKDATTTPVIKGEKVVSFKVTSPKMQTRYGEGAEANKLFWAVYKDGQRLDNVSVIDPAEAVAINMSVDVEITLMEGIDYDILFWAQNEDAPYTFDEEKVTIDYDALSANEEIYDAFFRNYHVDSEQTEPHRVELRRPFAQLNIGTADTAKAQSAGFTVENTSITVETCTVLNLATGEASEPKEITFEMNTKANDTYGKAPDTFDIISMNYLLVNNDKVMTTVTFNAEGGNDTIEREYLNVSLQRNHRTYILGDILTSSKLFNVYINPAFEDEHIYPEYAIYYTSSNGEIVEPYNKNAFGANIISNTYEDSVGKIVFDGPITEIGYEAFYYCSELTDISIPKSVTKIGYNAFFGCENLQEITIPESVTEIGHSAFSCCRSLTNITIPEGVERIGDLAFCNCNLTNVTIPDSVTHMEEAAFYQCENLQTITLSNNLTKIGPSTFYSCSSLTSMTIPSSVTSIGDYAFYGCKCLSSIDIPESVTSIGSFAFHGCHKLTSITIPDSVTEFGCGIFAYCINLQMFKGNLSSDNGRCLIKDGILIAYANASGTQYTIPNNVTMIGDAAFYEYSIRSISIPNSVIKIGDDAFHRCRSLIDITISDSVNEIGAGAFFDCERLTSIAIPNSVTKIEDWTFCGCEKLTSFTISSNIDSIGIYVFSGCRTLSSVYCKSTTPPTAVYSYGWHAFEDNAADRKIYVPTESLDAYKNAYGWKDYADRIVDGEF